MRVFKDSEGRSWKVAVTAASVGRVRDLVKVDLPGLFGGQMEKYAEFLVDPIQRANALYVLCKPEADERQISDEQFGAGLDGDAMEAATAALQEELIDFFPKAKRQPLRDILAKIEARRDQFLKRGLEELGKVNIEAEVEAEIAAIHKTWADKSSNSSGAVPASSA